MTNSCNDLLGNNNCAEVVGSTPTRSISFILGNYGIESGLFLGHCRIKAPTIPIPYPTLSYLSTAYSRIVDTAYTCRRSTTFPFEKPRYDVTVWLFFI